MKQLGLNVNSTCLLRKIYWKIFQDVSPPQNSVPALKYSIYGPPTLIPITATFLRIELLERRARIVNYLSDVCQQPLVPGVELRCAIAALNILGKGARAHTLLLLAHHGRLKHISTIFTVFAQENWNFLWRRFYYCSVWDDILCYRSGKLVGSTLLIKSV